MMDEFDLLAHNYATRAKKEDEISALRARISALEASVERWQEEARRYCQNAEFWRDKSLASESNMNGAVAMGDTSEPKPRSNEENLPYETAAVCEELLNHGEVANAQLLWLLQAIARLNDDLWHDRSPAVLDDSLGKVRDALDALTEALRKGQTKQENTDDDQRRTDRNSGGAG